MWQSGRRSTRIEWSTLLWDTLQYPLNGLFEHCINAKDLIQLFKNTPQSLGCATKLDKRLIAVAGSREEVRIFLESRRRKARYLN